MRHTFALASFILIAFSVAEAQVQPGGGNIAEQFIFNKERAFTYLQFDHVGKGPRRNENEPAYRIWFRLVNNCRVPIVIRTSGVPDGSPEGEVGLFHKVVANPPMYGVSGVLFSNPAQVLSWPKAPQPLLRCPTATTQTLAPRRLSKPHKVFCSAFRLIT